jgi:hypothetical protein
MVAVGVCQQHGREILPTQAVPLDTSADEARAETEIHQDG